MATMIMGRGPGPSGAPRVGGKGPGGGKAGIKAISGKQNENKLGKATGRDMSIPDKAASGSVPKGMSIYSNTRHIK